jgi:hypothetical protein
VVFTRVINTTHLDHPDRNQGRDIVTAVQITVLTAALSIVYLLRGVPHP